MKGIFRWCTFNGEACPRCRCFLSTPNDNDKWMCLRLCMSRSSAIKSVHFRAIKIIARGLDSDSQLIWIFLSQKLLSAPNICKHSSLDSISSLTDCNFAAKVNKRQSFQNSIDGHFFLMKRRDSLNGFSSGNRCRCLNEFHISLIVEKETKRELTYQYKSHNDPFVRHVWKWKIIRSRASRVWVGTHRIAERTKQLSCCKVH